MSDEAVEERASVEEPEHLGVRATWRRTPVAARALLAGVFVSRLAGFLQLYLVLFLTFRGFSTDQAGLALTIYGAGLVAGSFVGGWLSDRLSARSATMISMGGSAVLILSILYLKQYVLILLAVLLVSTVSQLYRPAAQSMITELVPSGQLVMVTAMYRLCLNLGTSAAPIIGTALVSVSYNLLFWGEAAAAVVYGLIALLALPRREKRVLTPQEQAAVANAPIPPKLGYRAVFADWRFMFFLAAVFSVMVVYSQYTAALPLAIKHAGLSLWWYSLVVVLNAALVVIVEVPVTKYVQKWPLRLTSIVGFGLVAVGYAIYAIDIAPLFLILGTLVWTATEVIGAPTTFAYPGIVAPAGLRGRYFGSLSTSVGLGQAIGPVLGVAIWNATGQAVWLWAAGLGLLSAVFARIGMRRPEPTKPAPPAAIVTPTVGEPAIEGAI